MKGRWEVIFAVAKSIKCFTAVRQSKSCVHSCDAYGQVKVWYPKEDLEAFWLGLWIERGGQTWQKRIAGWSVHRTNFSEKLVEKNWCIHLPKVFETVKWKECINLPESLVDDSALHRGDRCTVLGSPELFQGMGCSVMYCLPGSSFRYYY